MAQPVPPTRDPSHGPRDGDPDPDSIGADPTAAAGRRRSAAPHRDADPAPFAWQHGHRLFLLERDRLAWVLAELRFDAESCHYLELHRARYRWPREAAGSLLGRALSAGNALADTLASDLTAWIDAHHGKR